MGKKSELWRGGCKRVLLGVLGAGWGRVGAGLGWGALGGRGVGGRVSGGLWAPVGGVLGWCGAARGVTGGARRGMRGRAGTRGERWSASEQCKPQRGANTEPV